MVSLEEETKKTEIDKKKLIEKRRMDAFLKDSVGNMAMMFFGGLGTAIAASGAYHYFDKDKINFFACSAAVLMSGLVTGKGIYELGKAGIYYLRSIISKKPEIIDNYLKENYPDDCV